ncbi:MAG: dTMP kinase, partial [Gammaproteobacteria bacterium]
STNLTFITDYLRNAGVDLIVTREPGGTPLGEEIRSLLLSHRDEGMHPDTELLLMFAARAEHLRRKIQPALAAGQWVLSDRFTDATYAYQGGGRALDLQRIQILEEWTQGELRPDVTFLLDLDPEVGLARAAGRAELDRFEAEDLAFFHRVRHAYQARVEAQPERFRVVDAAQSLSDVQADLAAYLDALLQHAGVRDGG